VNANKSITTNSQSRCSKIWTALIAKLSRDDFAKPAISPTRDRCRFLRALTEFRLSDRAPVLQPQILRLRSQWSCRVSRRKFSLKEYRRSWQHSRARLRLAVRRPGRAECQASSHPGSQT